MRGQAVQRALALALGDAAIVRETGAENRGSRIREYWLNADPPVDIDHLEDAPPYCAAAVQFWTDGGCKLVRGVSNPLDEVGREGLVLDYATWADSSGRVIEPPEVQPGDLALYQFRGVRAWDHIGMTISTVAEDGSFRAVEANTPKATGSGEEQRGEDPEIEEGVFVKDRGTREGYPVLFVCWDPLY